MANERIHSKCYHRWHKNILKIRLHMWDVKKNYPKNDKSGICPIAEKKKIQQGMH